MCHHLYWPKVLYINCLCSVGGEIVWAENGLLNGHFSLPVPFSFFDIHLLFYSKANFCFLGFVSNQTINIAFLFLFLFLFKAPKLCLKLSVLDFMLRVCISVYILHLFYKFYSEGE